MIEKKRLFLPVLSFIIIVLCWEGVVRSGLISEVRLPAPSSVLSDFAKELWTGRVLVHLGDSLLRFGVGVTIAVVIAVPLGIVIGWSRTLRSAIDPLVEILRPIPPIAWIPLAILWFGIGLASKVFVVFIGAFFPILLNVISGVRSVDRVMIEAAETLGANDDVTLITKVVAPASMPSIFTGIRIGMGVGWMCIVAAEMIAASTGFGYMIMHARWIHDIPLAMTYMLFIGIIALILNTGLKRFEARTLRWRREVRA